MLAGSFSLEAPEEDTHGASNPLRVMDIAEWPTAPPTECVGMGEWMGLQESIDGDSTDASFSLLDTLPLQTKCAPIPVFVELIDTTLSGGLLAAVRGFNQARVEYNGSPTQLAIDHLRLRQIALDFLFNEVVANKDVIDRIRFSVPLSPDVHQAAFGLEASRVAREVSGTQFAHLCDECVQLWHAVRDDPLNEIDVAHMMSVARRLSSAFRLSKGRCQPRRGAAPQGTAPPKPPLASSPKLPLLVGIGVTALLSLAVVVLVAQSADTTPEIVAAVLSGISALICIGLIFSVTLRSAGGPVSPAPFNSNPSYRANDVEDSRIVELAAYFGGVAGAAERLCVEAVKTPATNRQSLSNLLGHDETALVPSHVVNEHMVVIGVSADMTVAFWNDEAVRVSGYPPEEVLGQPLLSVLDEGPVAAVTSILFGGLASTFPLDTVRIIGRRQQLLHLRATAARVDVGSIAAVVCGVVLDDFYRSTHSFVISCLSVQLQHDLQRLEPDNKASMDAYRSVAQLTTWSSINRIAGALSQWDRTSVDELLVQTTRRHFNRLTISIHRKGLPEVFLAGLRSVESALHAALKDSSGRLKVDLAFSHLSDDCEGFLYICIAGDCAPREPLVVEVCGVLADVGGIAFVGTRGGFIRQWLDHLSVGSSRSSAISHTEIMDRADEEDSCLGIILRVPVRQARGMMRVASSGSVVSAGAPSALSVNSQMAQQTEHVTMLLYEPHTLQRNNFCDVMWGNGQAVMLADSRDVVLRVLQSGTVQIEAVVVNTDHREGREIAAALREAVEGKQLIVVLTSEARGTTGQVAAAAFGNIGQQARQVLHLVKPFKRSLLISLIRRAIAQKAANLATARELEEQRRLFATHKSAPWKKGRLLGSGTSGDVYEAENLLTHGRMAVKVISTRSFDEARIASLTTEIKFMCALDHPNIVHYFNCEQGEDTLLLFMELCDDQLRGYVARQGGRLNLSEACSIIRQLIAALMYLHEKRIVHRDIKPENVLLSGGKAKLSDFGTAAEVAGPGNLTQTAGTFRYMAPEVFTGDSYGTTCDIWSLGVLFLDLLGLRITFLEGLDFLGMTEYYANLKPTDSVTLPEELTGDLLHFVQLCLTVDHNVRPSARTLQHHPILVSEMPEVFVCHVLEGEHVDGSRSSRGSMLIPGVSNQQADSGASGSDLIDFCAV